MTLSIEVEHEEDGRWIAEVIEFPGCQAHGQTQEDALTKVKVLGLRAMADRMEQGKFIPAAEDLFSVRILDLEQDSPELESELLKAAKGPFTPYSTEEMRSACEKVIREKRG